VSSGTRTKCRLSPIDVVSQAGDHVVLIWASLHSISLVRHGSKAPIDWRCHRRKKLVHVEKANNSSCQYRIDTASVVHLVWNLSITSLGLKRSSGGHKRLSKLQIERTCPPQGTH
jgi:hypothetical protein